ncbi:unnamed protein product [Schistosoma curassoni]|uniref:Uncharacterized protein n=1 Tax=Schistosoma curassoni TaxID=6186 RepID=A0A183K9N7_9TREM|nr:unnamed protein product [Schistosoma curassoni]
MIMIYRQFVVVLLLSVNFVVVIYSMRKQVYLTDLY